MSGKEKNADGRSRGGCVGKLSFLFVFCLMIAFGALLFFVAQPQPMDDIAGHGFSALPPEARDLVAVLKNSLDRGYPVELSEQEINAYLKKTLHAEQGGLLAQWVKFEGVAVRLEPGVAEVVMERSVMGQTLTISTFLRVEQLEAPDGKVTKELHRDGGQYHASLPKPLRGGRFGRVVIPQGFLVLVWPSFEALAKVYDRELRLCGEEMGRIKIEKDKLVLDPRPEGHLLDDPGNF
jgi:hypothetical protein